MRLLLDTHAFIWWFEGSNRLPATVREAIGVSANEVFVSAATAWEIATKHRLGKLKGVDELALSLPGYIASQRFESLPVTVEDGIRAGALPGPHRDPFDRMLVAQALGTDLALVSGESLFDQFGVRRLWEGG
ncbi:MAG: type II toxin-antitoxin system VapC family toxin [Dehalococcoidia bacterium]|nr:type II toxin-antitoxin system VapC family toxin [Dehalococcoidia bacterium]